MSALREKMAADLQLRGITPRTQKKYLREVSNLAKYHNKSPQDLGEQEVKDYLVHLLNDRGLSVGTYRTYVAGIKFLYTTTLNRPEVVDKIKYPKSTHKLPEVFDLSEIKALLSVMDNLKHRAILTIFYSAGLRVSEVARLRMTDIDSKRMMVRVQQGKGRKDRYSILCKTPLSASDSTGGRIAPRNGCLKDKARTPISATRPYGTSSLRPKSVPAYANRRALTPSGIASRPI